MSYVRSNSYSLTGFFIRRDYARARDEARKLLGLDVSDTPRWLKVEARDRHSEADYPDKFHRYCPEHLEKLNWLLCPKGHESSVWIVKDEETGEVIDVCRDNDGTQQWKGFAPRH